ncbi:MAG: hypothetical protein V4805_18755, partial [Pseudomonadota bacterium]
SIIPTFIMPSCQRINEPLSCAVMVPPGTVTAVTIAAIKQVLGLIKTVNGLLFQQLNWDNTSDNWHHRNKLLHPELFVNRSA